MVTRYIKIDSLDTPELNDAAEAIKNGRLVAFPTETVYGLGANALDGKAVLSIYEAKGRPSDNPLIVHISEPSMLKPLVKSVSADAEKLMHAFWPGPLTLIFEKTAIVPKEATAGLDTVAVRMPNHPIALELIRRSGVPIAAPSANRSGKPSPTLAEHVAEDMDGRISFILDGGPCEVGVESTILDMTSDPPAILRPGGITPVMIDKVIGHAQADRNNHPMEEHEKPKAPGMKYTHYAPKGEVTVVSGKHQNVFAWINAQMHKDWESGVSSVVVAAREHLSNYPDERSIPYGSIQDPGEVASNIYRIFRDCDRLGMEKIYVEAIPKEEIGIAVMNRVEKAAGGRVIQV